MEIKQIINVILYILCFIILFNYIRNWNKNMKYIMNLKNNKTTHNNLDTFNNINNNLDTFNNINNNLDTFNNINNNLDNIKQNSGYEVVGDYLCDSKIDISKLGYANETETNEYQHLDEEIQKQTNGYNYKTKFTQEDEKKYLEFKKKIKDLENKYSGVELFYYKNKAFREYLNTQEHYTKEYLELPNVDPKNDPIKLTNTYPRYRKDKMEFQKRFFYKQMNDDYSKMNYDDKLFLDKYGWLNKMGQPLLLPDDFNLKTTNDEILEYRKLNSGRLPQHILTDYNPYIKGCNRLTKECVTRIHDKFNLQSYTREDYDKYINNITNKEYTNKYYEILGMK
jgi:hypothetical protein